MPPFLEKAERYILNHLDSASSMLVVMGIVGTVTSSIAQQIGIKANKHIPEDTKTFLINQERNDCMLSAGLTWLTGNYSKKIVHSLTNNGYLLNDEVRSAADVIARENGMTHRELAKSGFYKVVENNLPRLNIYNKKYKSLKNSFDRCQEGLSIIAAIGAAILTTNVIVPILRNKLSKSPVKEERKQPVNLSTNVIKTYPSKLLNTHSYNNTYSNSLKI